MWLVINKYSCCMLQVFSLYCSSLKMTTSKIPADIFVPTPATRHGRHPGPPPAVRRHARVTAKSGGERRRRGRLQHGEDSGGKDSRSQRRTPVVGAWRRVGHAVVEPEPRAGGGRAHCLARCAGLQDSRRLECSTDAESTNSCRSRAT